MTIEIYSITGELVTTVIDEQVKSAGPHQEETWAGENYASREVIAGTYICQITAEYGSGETERFRRKLVVIR